MKTHTLTTLFVIALVLAACQPATSIPPTAARTPEPPTLIPSITPAPTLTDTPEPTVDPYATYHNSFEEITDLSASGITSNQNGIPAESQNAIRINNEIVHSGSQSLEAYDSPGSQGNARISIDFPIRSLIGRTAIDLSQKMFHASVFIPQGSSVQNVRFGCSRDSTSIVIGLNSGGGGNDAPDVKGRWLSLDYSIKMMFESPYFWGNENGNTEKDILANCDKISLVGNRSTPGDTRPASFMVDDLEWRDVPYSADSIPVDKNAESLRKYADLHNLKIGTVLIVGQWLDGLEDPHYVQTLAQEFNLVCAINSWWPEKQPASASDMVFDYTQDDAVAKLFLGSQVSLKGTTGGWNLQLPGWILDADFNALQPYLESRVEQDVSRYKGNMYMWDVFNETISWRYNGLVNRQHKNTSEAQWGAPYGSDYSPWVDGNDTSLIRAAFVKARQSDPNAKLFLNENNTVEIMGNPKAEALYHLVADLKQQGVPIDGVGFQFRYSINGDNVDIPGYPAQTVNTFLKNVDKTVKRYADLGVLVEFSEVEIAIRLDDIDFSTPAGKSVYEERLAEQAKMYGGLAKIAVENKNVAAIIIWMMTDRYAQGMFGPNYGDTSILDADYQPKPAYYAILNELKK
jgi:endo-1,4-beta-xylanase